MTKYKHLYTDDEVEVLKEKYILEDCRTWPYYPIVMPLEDGRGPVPVNLANSITWEVWDKFYNSSASFDYLPDAINYAIKMNKDLFEGGKNDEV